MNKTLNNRYSQAVVFYYDRQDLNRFLFNYSIKKKDLRFYESLFWWSCGESHPGPYGDRSFVYKLS